MPDSDLSSETSASSWRSKATLDGLALCLLSAVVFLTGLGATHLWDDDETYFAQVAREMFDRGDIIVPWFNQELFAHKPPIMYWLMMAAYGIFGVNEFAARLPAALFGIANVLLVWRLGCRLYSPRAGFWAGVVLATSLNFVVIARAATCDSELVFFCTLAVFLFVRGSWRTRNPAGGFCEQATSTAGSTVSTQLAGLATWAAVYAAMGAAVMVKGPIGLLLPGCVLGLHLLLVRGFLESPSALANDAALSAWGKLRQWIVRLLVSVNPWRIAQTTWQMRPWLAVLMVLAVAGPWFALVGWKTNGAFHEGFFGVHNFHRFTATMDNHAGPAWFYLAAICVGFFPWILMLRPAAIEWLRRYREEPETRPSDLLILAWCVVWVGFFSLASTKFPHYVVPAYPALALFTGSFIARWIERPEICAQWRQRLMWISLLLIGIGVMFVPLAVARRFQIEARWLWAPGVPIVLGAFAAWRLGMRGEIRRSAIWMTASTVAFLLLLLTITAAEVDREQCTVSLADGVEATTDSRQVRIASWRFFRPGLVYYAADRVGVSRIESLETVEAVDEWLLKSDQTSYLVAREEDYQNERDRMPANIEVVSRANWFLKPGQRLVLLKRAATQIGTATPFEGSSTVKN